MEIEPIRLVKFDVHGTEPLNKFVREEHPLKDKNCRWVIPNGSPFFGEAAITEVYNKDGGILKLGRDYFLDGEFTPFCLLTGRSITSWIKLSQETLDENDKIFIDYQSIGAWWVPRNSVEEWVTKMTTAKEPIQFELVQGVPPTVPASDHWHNIKTEIGDWYELTDIFANLSNGLGSRDFTLNDNITPLLPILSEQVAPPYREKMGLLIPHDRDYDNPHEAEAVDFNLDKVSNFRLATVPEDIAGGSNILFSTPLGIQSMIQDKVNKVGVPLKAGALPLSHYLGNPTANPAVTKGPGAWEINIRGDVPLLLGGASYLAPAEQILLSSFDRTLTAAGTLYLYVTVNGDTPKYVVSGVQYRKSNTLLKIADIITNSSGISTLTLYNPVMVGKYLLSETRSGGTIPVSKGLPQDPGEFKLLRSSELLP